MSRTPIDGLGGDDIIYGLGGNDHITGGAGADFIFGGAGFDTAYYVDSDAGVFIDLTASSGRYGSAEGDLLISIEALVGSRFDDNLIGNAEDNDLRGGDGADYLYGLDGSDWLQGGLGADTIIGGDDWRFDFADYSDSSSESSSSCSTIPAPSVPPRGIVFSASRALLAPRSRLPRRRCQ